MVSTDIFIAPRKTPWNRKARDEAPGKSLGLMGLQHCGTHPIVFEVWPSGLPGRGSVAALSAIGRRNVARTCSNLCCIPARACCAASRRPLTESDREDKFASGRLPVDLRQQCHVSVWSQCCVAWSADGVVEIVQSITLANEAAGGLQKRYRAYCQPWRHLDAQQRA